MPQDSHIWPPYTPLIGAPVPPVVASASGTTLTLEDGTALVDGISSWWTAVHGYAHPTLIDAAKAQLETLPHVMLGGLSHRPARVLAEKLCALSGDNFARVFFSESGSVAVEVALKMAFQSWLDSERHAAPRALCFRGGYHGDTFATMAVCDPDEGMHRRFSGVLNNHMVGDLPTSDAAGEALIEQALARGDIAAVIAEPRLQGAGGLRVHDAATLRRLRRIADRIGAWLIFDEIASGCHRTGPFLAHHGSQAAPDIICLGKGLTGGVVPFAATVAHTRVAAAFASPDPARTLMHGPTFSGYATGCAVALASLSLFEQEDYAAKAARIAAHLEDALGPLRRHAAVADVRVLGAMGAVEFNRDIDREACVAFMMARGVWLRPIGRVLYTMPPMVIDDSALRKITDAMVAYTDACGPQ